MFSRQSKEHVFKLSNGVTFSQLVVVNTVVSKPELRFGIDQQRIDRFINRILEVEVEGRKFRTKHQISMTNGAPQAENFMWVILGNKVSYRELVVKWVKPLTVVVEVFRRLRVRILKSAQRFVSEKRFESEFEISTTTDKQKECLQ